MAVTTASDRAASMLPKIEKEHRLVIEAHERGLAHAIKCGEYLTQAKKLLKAGGLGRGGWEAWVEAHCEFTSRTARGYMRVFRQQDSIPQRDEVSYRRALHCLVTRPGTAKKRKRKAVGHVVVTAAQLQQAVETYYADVERDELLALLTALGVEVA